MIDKSKLKLYKGLWTRPDMRADGAMVKEVAVNYRHFRFNAESVVLDLGANIGAFGRMALNAGVRPANYFAVEPDPNNIELLLLNTSSDIGLFRGVATMSKDDSVTFYQTESSNAACSGTATPPTNQSKSMRKIRYDVRNRYLPELVDAIAPTHLKVDIEGAEHDWLMQNEFSFHDNIQEIAIELHRHDTIEMAEQLWPYVKQEYDVIAVTANDGFIKPDSKIWSFPNLGIEGKGVLFGVDIFLRRK